jgi:hypothetical protein
MTCLDHEHSASVEQAAQWLADQNPPPSPVVPALRQRFDLNPSEACEAISLARSFRINRRAFG